MRRKKEMEMILSPTLSKALPENTFMEKLFNFPGRVFSKWGF
jgi:hypothetical protein